jgi:hypothetical protein
MKRFINVAAVLVILLATASVSSAQFATLQSGFTQSIFGTSTSDLGGVAFAPNGDVWAAQCFFHGGALYRFPLQGHPVAVNTGTPGLTGCGLTNHPNGKLYSNTDLGVAELSNPATSDTAPTLMRTIGQPGNALGITVDPQTSHVVYVGQNCRFTPTCTIYSLDVTNGSTTTFAALDQTFAAFVDGIAFDPTGNFLFLSTRSHWDGSAYTTAAFLVTVLNRAGNVVQQFSNDTCGDGCTNHEPDGIAFHSGAPPFVVVDNTDGTMSRFDFTNNDLTTAPAGTLFASGGLRGDLSGVGPDGCLYISQGQGNATEDVAQICGGFSSAASSQSVTVQFTPSTTPETQIATVGNPADPAAQSLALTLPSVTNALNVSVTFFYEPTDLSTNSHGVGIADGVCESGATEDQDFDCRLATAFTYPDGGTLTPGDKLVPHIIPSHNNLGVWLRVIATRVSDGQPAQAGVDYGFGVNWYYAWNTNPPLSAPQIFAAVNTVVGVPNPEYPAGWNEQNPQMYDRPGENPDPAFVKNITTYLKNCAPNCVGTADPGLGGKTITLNDIVAAAPPKSPTGTGADVIEVQVPFPNVATFPYYKGSPMLVAFEIENPTTDQSDPTAVTAPHSVNVSTLEAATGKNVPVQYPRGFPTTVKYNATTKSYYIFLSPAPYKTDGTVYTLQINSDLLAAPKTANFVVKRDQ